MLRVAIIGAGVAGGVIARGLRACDQVEVTVLEQVGAQDHASAGNGLNIGPNALKALETILPDMADELRQASLPWTRWKARLVTGAPLYHIPLDQVADNPGIRIRWSELYGIARRPIEAATRFEQRLTGLDHSGDTVALTVEDMRSGAREVLRGFDLVVACDGRYSRVREICLGSPMPRHLRVANFRLLIDDNGRSGIGDMDQWFHGPSRLLAFRLNDGKLYLSGNFPAAGSGEIEARQKTAQFIRGACLPHGGPVEAACTFLVDAACEQLQALHWSRAQEIPAAYRDAGGHVQFVGDAAHAMAPTLGQGATQAIEDGCAFIALFRSMADSGNADVPALTSAFERLRRERVEFVRRLSWDASAPLLAGSDPVESNRDKSGDGFHCALRRLYRDVPLGLSPRERTAA